MKRTILFLLFSLFSAKISAQKFRAEIQAGIVGTQVSGDELSGFDKAGLLIGGGVRLKIDEKWSFGLRMLYLQKGSRKPSKLDQGDPSTYLLRLNYLEFPLLFRYRIIPKLYIEAGPTLGYLLSSLEENEDGELSDREDFSKTDFGIWGSLGYPLGKNWDIQLIYSQSLLPIREHSGGATYRLNQGQYNTVLGFSLLHTFIPKSSK